MAYDVRLVKLIDGEMVIAKWDEEAGVMKDPAILQTVPTEQGVQMMLLPFGYPFEMEISGEISLEHVLYKYASFPEELKTKYLEAVSKLTLSGTSGGLGGLGLGGAGRGAGMGNISGLLKGK